MRVRVCVRVSHQIQSVRVHSVCVNIVRSTRVCVCVRTHTPPETVHVAFMYLGVHVCVCVCVCVRARVYGVSKETASVPQNERVQKHRQLLKEGGMKEEEEEEERRKRRGGGESLLKDKPWD